MKRRFDFIDECDLLVDIGRMASLNAGYTLVNAFALNVEGTAYVVIGRKYRHIDDSSDEMEATYACWTFYPCKAYNYFCHGHYFDEFYDALKYCMEKYIESVS